jgi:ubiquinone/menaquinone biosynthesis C-methylase UbiE
MFDPKTHWENIYGQKKPNEVSWYTPHLNSSLQVLTSAGLNPSSHLIDVGAGASTLVDDLIKRGTKSMTILDISGEALAVSKARLGQRANEVEWIEADITQAKLRKEYYDNWHDRAVFHFLTNIEDRRRYVAAMTDALKPQGQLAMATFSLQGPLRCSGLDIVRYSSQTLQAELGKGFRLIEALEEEHQTPFNTAQKFIYCRFQKVS